MELILILQMIKRRWWLIAIPTVVALLLTLPQLKDIVSPTVTYAVQIRLTAAAPPDAELEGVTTPYEDAVYVPLLASEYVVVNMPAWITSDSFANEVNQILTAQDVHVSEGDLHTAFYADGLRSVMTLYVNWDNADEIRAIAEAAVTVLQTRNQAYFPPFAAVPVQVVPLDDIEVVEAAPPITGRMMPLIRIFLGLAAGGGLAVLAEYLDTTVRSREDVESLGLVVLAEVPPER